MKLTKGFLLNENQYDGITDYWNMLGIKDKTHEKYNELNRLDRGQVYLVSDGEDSYLYGIKSGFLYVKCVGKGNSIQKMSSWVKDNQFKEVSEPNNPPHKDPNSPYYNFHESDYFHGVLPHPSSRI